MGNNTQLDRYKRLIAFIEDNLTEEINIERIEAVCHYSYRNINRIFQALHQESIGKYIKRLRLEKGAQYLKYSDMPVSDIAYELGFEDRASFSKAFKKKYKCAPTLFRSKSESSIDAIRKSFLPRLDQEREKLQFEIEYLPEFDYIFLEYRGNYLDISRVEEVWKQLEVYAQKKKLLSEASIFMTAILDDEEISDQIHSRYNSAFILEKPLNFVPEGLFRLKRHHRQKYAKFTHQGSYESSVELYNKIYAFWMLDIGLELEDLPTLEFYPNYNENTPPDELLTQIYIPVK